MNNEFYLNGETSTVCWFQRTRIYKLITNPMFILSIILIILFIIVIYWKYIRTMSYKKIYKKLLQFKGFKYSHLTNQEREAAATEDIPVLKNTNCHCLIYGTSGSGKTSFLKHYLALRQADYLVFGRDEREFPSKNFINLLHFENLSIEQLANKTVILDDAGAYKSLKTKVEDLFRYGRHHNIQVIYLTHYAKDVLPIVRENCHKIFLTVNNPDNFFESIVQTYSIKELNWNYYRDKLEYGIIEFDTRSQKYKVLNHEYNFIYDSSKRSKWGPEDYVGYESYFFTGDEYNRLKVFLEYMSDQTIEITPLNIAFYYVYFCKQNKIKVNESKIDNYIERMQQRLISNELQEKDEDFKKIIYDHAKTFTKNKLNSF